MITERKDLSLWQVLPELSIVLAASSIGSVPVLAAETIGREIMSVRKEVGTEEIEEPEQGDDVKEEIEASNDNEYSDDQAGNGTSALISDERDSGSDNGSPWCLNNGRISRVVIEDGITGIDKYAFSNCGTLTRGMTRFIPV